MNRVWPGNSYLLLLGTLFGAGYLPKAPGTWGSLFFLPFIFAAYQYLGFPGLAGLVCIASVLSLVTAPAAIIHLGPDPAEFVMDECAGQAIVFAIALPLLNRDLDLALLVMGFFLFRLFDIMKPLGIRRVEKFRGKYGILADDLVAGMYASLSLMAIMYILSHVK